MAYYALPLPDIPVLCVIVCKLVPCPARLAAPKHCGSTRVTAALV